MRLPTARLGHKLSRISSERVHMCSQLTVASDFQLSGDCVLLSMPTKQAEKIVVPTSRNNYYDRTKEGQPFF